MRFYLVENDLNFQLISPQKNIYIYIYFLSHQISIIKIVSWGSSHQTRQYSMWIATAVLEGLTAGKNQAGYAEDPPPKVTDLVTGLS